MFDQNHQGFEQRHSAKFKGEEKFQHEKKRNMTSLSYLEFSVYIIPGKTKTALRKHLTWILSSPMLSSLEVLPVFGFLAIFLVQMTPLNDQGIRWKKPFCGAFCAAHLLEIKRISRVQSVMTKLVINDTFKEQIIFRFSLAKPDVARKIFTCKSVPVHEN